MKIGICEIGYIPLRAGMSHKSEMLNQILFGECFEILIHRSDWTKVRLIHDDYEGWIDSNVIADIVEKEDVGKDYIFEGLICSESQTEILLDSQQKMIIPLGAVIPACDEGTNEFSIGSNKYSFDNSKFASISENKREFIVQKSLEMLNTPYLWGGRTAFGLDCSGFSQLLYRLVACNIPRDASKQIKLGNTLSFLAEANPGDLAFFDNEEGNIVHVGVILDGSRIIHASGKVRIDTIDHQGIYNKNIKRYTHSLRLVKSIL
ncbi:MAG: C40 family peptidase [Bacteroidales bacterium]|nr:C40 family peptidase [Bacteroidales bacterium]